MAKKLQTHRAGVLGHAVQHPAGARDQAVAAFLLHPRQTREKLVGDILAQPRLAKTAPRYVEPLGAYRRLAIGFEMPQLETGHLDIVDLAHVVVQAHHFQPGGLRRDHAPGRQVVQRGAPKHRLLATGVHGNVAANARGLSRGGIDGKHQPGTVGGIGHALGDHAGLGPDRGHWLLQARQQQRLDLTEGLELLGIDHGRLPAQGDRPAGVACAAAARHDGQPQLDAGLDQTGHLGLAVRSEHHEGVLDAPVGGVGHMRDARKAVELDVVPGGELAQLALGLLAQLSHLLKTAGKTLHGSVGQLEQLAHDAVTHCIKVGGAALLHLAQAMLERLDQQAPAARVVEQIVLQIGVALHHPDVAQHLVEHAGRTTGVPLRAQLGQQTPSLGPEDPDDHFPVRKRGVVVGDLADAGALRAFGQACGLGHRGKKVGRSRGVHVRQSARAGPVAASADRTAWRGSVMLPQHPLAPARHWQRPTAPRGMAFSGAKVPARSSGSAPKRPPGPHTPGLCRARQKTGWPPPPSH